MADMFCHELIDASFFEYLISFWIINQIDVIFAIFAFEGAIRQESAYWPVPRLVNGSKFGPIWQKKPRLVLHITYLFFDGVFQD